jgi:transcriptional regulator with XRE-family HTH domain
MSYTPKYEDKRLKLSLEKRRGKTFPNIAKLIRMARVENNNISQISLGYLVGYEASNKAAHCQYISNIERGLCSIPAKRVKLLAKALNLDITKIKEAMIQDFLFNLDKEIENGEFEIEKTDKSDQG